jgi:hypothetical protein
MRRCLVFWRSFLVYLDPPFDSNANYNVLLTLRVLVGHSAAGQHFEGVREAAGTCPACRGAACTRCRIGRKQAGVETFTPRVAAPASDYL